MNSRLTFCPNKTILSLFLEVYCEVEPKRHALAQANVELAAATEKLEAIRKKLVVSTV